MRLAIVGAVLLLVGGVAVATGALPLPDLSALAERVGPVLASGSAPAGATARARGGAAVIGNPEPRRASGSGPGQGQR
jgi:hypothetical protein